MTPALLGVAHGSRDPRAAATIAALLDRVRGLLPGVPVRLAWLDHREPPVPAALARLAAVGCPGAVVVPLLLTVGYHSRTDLPALLADPPLPVTQTPVLGPADLLTDALVDRLAAAGVTADAPVVLAAAGSSDPTAQRDVRRAAELLATRRTAHVLPAYATAAAPSVVDALATAGPGAAVAAYFLAPGALPDRVLVAAAGARVTAPLGDTDPVARLVTGRYAAAAPAPSSPPPTPSPSRRRPPELHRSC